MSIPLNLIPIELLSEILKKMIPPVFYRMRQTCRQMEEFVERNRFKTNTFFPVHSMLLISVGEDSKTGFIFEVITYQNTIGTSLLAYREKGNKLAPNGITDPYKQLSAIRFSTILVNYSKNSNTFFESYSFKSVFLPLVQKLRLQGIVLCFYDKEQRHQYANNILMQSCFQFNSLQNYTAVHALENQVFKNMTHASLGWFLETPKNLASMIRHLQYVWLGKAEENNDPFVSVLEEFLEDVCANKYARGNLKEITFETGQRYELSKPSCLMDLWQGEVNYHGKKQKVQLYKLVFDDGVAIISHFSDYGGIFVVNFLNNYNRKALFNFLSISMLTDELKNPGVFDAFFAANNDVTAMKALNPPPPLQ